LPADLNSILEYDAHPIYQKQLWIVRSLKQLRGLFFRISDFLAILAAPLCDCTLQQRTESPGRSLCFWTLLSVFTVLMIASHGGYRASERAALRKQTGLAINCFLMTSSAMLIFACIMGHAHILARRWTAADLVITPFLISGARRLLARKLATGQKDLPARGPIVVCYDRYPPDLTRALIEQYLSPDISGVVFLTKPANVSEGGGYPRFTDINSMLSALKTLKIKDVVFVQHPELDSLANQIRLEILSDILSHPARIWLAFDLAGQLPEFMRHRTGTCKLVAIVNEELVTSLNLTKRIFDLVVGGILLILTLPLLLGIALLVKASGPGPVVFRQIRTGAQGQTFTVLKFRTMTDDPSVPFAQAKANDPRITSVGRFLRRNSLDELLQIVNVLKGDMSLVGPRPHAPETQVEGINFENAVRLYRMRHRVKPGITGLAQIRGQRGETKAVQMLEQRLASDLEYIQSWSLWLDISILIQTLPTAVARTNAV